MFFWQESRVDQLCFICSHILSVNFTREIDIQRFVTKKPQTALTGICALASMQGNGVSWSIQKSALLTWLGLTHVLEQCNTPTRPGRKLTESKEELLDPACNWPVVPGLVDQCTRKGRKAACQPPGGTESALQGQRREKERESQRKNESELHTTGHANAQQPWPPTYNTKSNTGSGSGKSRANPPPGRREQFREED